MTTYIHLLQSGTEPPSADGPSQKIQKVPKKGGSFSLYPFSYDVTLQNLRFYTQNLKILKWGYSGQNKQYQVEPPSVIYGIPKEIIEPI